MTNIKTNKKEVRQYIQSVGRRKSAIARVRLYNPKNGKVEVLGIPLKKGEMIVNGKMIQEFFRFKPSAPLYNKIFLDTNTSGKFIFSAKVEGGGPAGQLDAIVLGVARVLDKFDTDAYHSVLREKGYLTRDARVRERRKVGTGGKARRKKQSPKR